MTKVVSTSHLIRAVLIVLLIVGAMLVMFVAIAGLFLAMYFSGYYSDATSFQAALEFFLTAVYSKLVYVVGLAALFVFLTIFMKVVGYIENKVEKHKAQKLSA